MIYFLNKLAARFPDKEFATLAYLYTMNPPKHINLPNVTVMLCDIDCEREVSLTENASGRQFMKALEAGRRYQTISLYGTMELISTIICHLSRIFIFCRIIIRTFR